MSTAYALRQSDRVVTDGFASERNRLWLHDLPHPDNWRVESLVASGEYCEMLASVLEQVASALPATCMEQYQIQDAIGQLLYIQRHYQFTKRKNTTHWRLKGQQNLGD